jgi:23S rRNA pseudouridine2605 synthase
MEERLQKVLSGLGVASRRQVEQMIAQGRVQVNHSLAHLGQKVDLARDRILVDGVLVSPATRPEPLCLLIHKPAGVVSTCDDPWGRQTVLDLLPEELRQGKGLHPVGRLDADSTGALLLTNDGNLTFYLTHPRHHIPKSYQVWVKGYPAQETLQRWQQGVWLDGRKTLPAKVTKLKRHPDDKTLLEVVLEEGRNRQIRRVAELLGHPVVQLHRVAIGPIRLQTPELPDLLPGCYRPLTDKEVAFLNSQIDLPSYWEPAKSEECSV